MRRKAQGSKAPSPWEKNLCLIARGSASELEYQILLAHDLKLIASGRYEELSQEVTDIKRMLTVLYSLLFEELDALLECVLAGGFWKSKGGEKCRPTSAGGVSYFPQARSKIFFLRWYKRPKPQAYCIAGVLVHNQPIMPDQASSVLGVALVGGRNLSDEEIMAQVRQGHPDALPCLFDRFHRLVLKVALRIVRDPGEAEDVMQEVFFEIFRKAAQFDPAKGSTKTWILQYAYHRSLSRRQYLALRNFYTQHQISEEEVSESIPLGVSWRGLTFQEWRRVIEQGLATLNEKQRRTLELSCFQGLLLSEIAERTKESLPNVRHHYYRGLDALRKFLQARTGPEANDVES